MATTPKGFPYPLGTDRVMDGDDAIAALANAIDQRLGVAAAGLASPNVTTAGTAASVAVTFPAGRFSAVPRVVTGTMVNNPSAFGCSAAGVTATGFVAWGWRSGTGAVDVQWYAVQLP